VTAVIPTRGGERRRSFDPVAYRRRNVVERCVGWLKGFRRIGTRSEKLAVTYAAMLTLAMIRVLLSFE
jgi:transposase